MKQLLAAALHLLAFALLAESAAELNDHFISVPIKDYLPARIVRDPHTSNLLVAGSTTKDIGSTGKVFNDKASDAIFGAINPKTAVFEWTAFFGKEGDQIAHKIMVDAASGSTYVIGTTLAAFAGESKWPAGAYRMFIAKFASGAKVPVWQKIFGPLNSMLLDAIFIPGDSTGSSSIAVSSLEGVLGSNVHVISGLDAAIPTVGQEHILFPVFIRTFFWDAEKNRVLAVGLAFEESGVVKPPSMGASFVGIFDPSNLVISSVIHFFDADVSLTDGACGDGCKSLFMTGGKRLSSGDINNVLIAYDVERNKVSWLKSWGSTKVDAGAQIVYSPFHKAVLVSGISMGDMPDHPNAGNEDAYIASFSALDGSLRYTRYFGSAEIDVISSIAIDPKDGTAYLLLHHLVDYDTATAAYLISINSYLPATYASIETKNLDPPGSPGAPAAPGTPAAPSNEKSEHVKGSKSIVGPMFLVLIMMSIVGGIGYAMYQQYVRPRARFIQIPGDEEHILSPVSHADTV